MRGATPAGFGFSSPSTTPNQTDQERAVDAASSASLTDDPVASATAGPTPGAEAAGTPGKVSLREQADEAHRELAMRHRVYPGLVSRGWMTQAEAAVAIRRMRAIRDTLRIFSMHEDAIRIALATAIARDRERAEADALRTHPHVQAVLDVFPDASITTVTSLED